MQIRFSDASLRRDDGGASVIEFAVLAPVFLLILTGIIAYALYFGASHSIQQLAADAARTALAGINATERETLVASFLTNNADGYPLVDLDEISHSVATNPLDANQVSVTISYDVSNLPIWDLHAPLPLPGTTITRSSTVRIGGF